MLAQALRCLFATPLSLGWLCNGMFYVKLLQAQRPFISFTVFSGRLCTFFCVQVGFRPCWSRLCVVFFFCGVFSRKMCCNRFLLIRFCTTLFALFHVRKQFNVAFVNVDVSGNKKACFLQVVLCKRVLQCTAYCKTQGDEKPFSQRCACDIMFFEVITIHTGKMR